METGVKADKVWEPLGGCPALGGVSQEAMLPPALKLILCVPLNTLTREDGAGDGSKVVQYHDE